MQKLSNLQAISFALMGTISMAVVDASMKWLVADYSVPQLLALRAWLLFPVAVAWVLMSEGVYGLRPPEWRLLLVRSIFLIIAPFLFFTGLKTVPLAEATVLFFTAPLFITTSSVFLFGDKVGPWRWFAVLTGFVGALIVLRPGFGIFRTDSLFPLAAAFLYGISALLARHLSGRTKLARLMMFQTLAWSFVYGLVALPDWSPMPMRDVLLVGMTSFFNLLTMIGLTTAYMNAPAHVVGPFEYVSLPFAILFGYLLWGDLPDPVVYAGAGLIVGAGLLVLYRETVNRRRVKRAMAS